MPQEIIGCWPVKPVGSESPSSSATCSRATTSSTRSTRPQQQRAAAAGRAAAPRARRREGPDAALADAHGHPLRRLPRDADPPGRADARPRRARARSTSRSPVDFEDRKLVVAFAEPADDEARRRGRQRDRLRDHPGGRRPRRAAARDRHDLRPAPTRAAPAPTRGRRRRRRRRGSPRRRAARQRPARARARVRAAPTSTSPPGSPPVVRVHGDLHPMPDLPTLNGSEIRQMVYAILTQKQREKFENELELDTSYALPGKGRFRVNVFLQRDSVGCVMRAIPYEIVDFDALGLPPVGEAVRRTCPAAWCSSPARPVRASRRRSRRSSTSSTASRPVHIMTVEDPIEFLHTAQAVGRQPARGRGGHALVRQRAEARAAPGPRRHPRR